MAEHPNVKKARDAYEAFGNLDLATALKDVAPDAIFHFHGTGPSGGDHQGVDAITAALVDAFETTAGTQKLDISNVFADESHAVLTIHENSSRPDGATLDMDEVHLLSFNSEGQITDLWDIPADPDAHDRFFDGL
jgi:ketosteroid isomerase-like protein